MKQIAPRKVRVVVVGDVASSRATSQLTVLFVAEKRS